MSLQMLLKRLSTPRQLNDLHELSEREYAYCYVFLKLVFTPLTHCGGIKIRGYDKTARRVEKLENMR